MMIINGYIGIEIFIVIVRTIPTNPKPLFNVCAFTFILENRDWNNKVILKVQTPFNQIIKKNVAQNYQTNAGKKANPKNQNGQILSAFWP